MSKYVKQFIKEEEGIETIEFIGLVAVAAVLIGVIATLGKSMKDRVTASQQKMDNAFTNLDTTMGDVPANSGGPVG